MAGYDKNPEQIGAMLLSKDEIQKEVKRLFERQKNSTAISALCGLRRLAFGSIADGVRLLYMQSPTALQLEGMDLYSVSEIKRPKDGAMEIKFCDRQKALEALIEADNTSNTDTALQFYNALQQSASSIANSKSEVEDSGV